MPSATTEVAPGEAAKQSTRAGHDPWDVPYTGFTSRRLFEKANCWWNVLSCATANPPPSPIVINAWGFFQAVLCWLCSC